MTPNQTFKEAISEIKHRAAQTIIDTMEDSPKDALGYVDAVRGQVFGEMTVNEKLRVLSQIDNVGDIEMSFRFFDTYGDVAEVIDSMFSACVDHHLYDFRSGVATSAFAIGFLPAALAMVELAERSGGSKWIPADQIEVVRSAYDRLAASEGSLADLDDLIGGVYLFEKLMRSPKDRVLHNRHNTTMDEMTAVVTEVKFYRNLLGEGRPLAENALETLTSRQRNLPIIRAEHEHLKAARARLGR